MRAIFILFAKVGKQQHFELGKYLRRRYRKLIGTRYSADKVYIRSSDTDRTLMSAQCNAAGWFEPTEGEVWNKALAWQPIPIHTVPYNEDYLLVHDLICPRHTQLYKEFTESTKFKYNMNRSADLISFLSLKTGRTLSNPIEVMYLIMLLEEEKERGFDLPSWVNDISRYTNDTLEQISTIHMESFTHTNEMKKIKAGFLIKEMFDRFKNKSLSLLQPHLSIWAYSAHDLNIVSVLNALNLYELHVPPYASSLFFELYRQNDSYFVQLFYRKTPTENVPALNIPNCGTMCPLDKFYVLYRHILPTDYEDFESLCRLST
ncbi:prostatic acid phosphatase-like [Sitodiplosis mosellana]|uniref:prostatic acid phosphatase-like n=1 Tax=Sitodiplosis mosellana TaxID=263140 RepID=UPI002444B3ED|nr:prostatic acid phosphatase-like [Sitodiplosis mosellana]